MWCQIHAAHVQETQGYRLFNEGSWSCDAGRPGKEGHDAEPSEMLQPEA